MSALAEHASKPESARMGENTNPFLDSSDKAPSESSIQPDMPLSTAPGNAASTKTASKSVMSDNHDPLARPWVFRYPEDHMFEPNAALSFQHTWSDVIQHNVEAPLLGNVYEVPGPGQCVNWRDHPYFKLQFKFNATAQSQQQLQPSPDAVALAPASAQSTKPSSTSTSGDSGSVGHTTVFSKLQERRDNRANGMKGKRRWSVDRFRASIKDLFRHRKIKDRQQRKQQQREAEEKKEAERKERLEQMPMEAILGLMARNDRYAKDLTPETRAEYLAAEHNANMENENREEANKRKHDSVQRSKSDTK